MWPFLWPMEDMLFNNGFQCNDLYTPSPPYKKLTPNYKIQSVLTAEYEFNPIPLLIFLYCIVYLYSAQWVGCWTRISRVGVRSSLIPTVSCGITSLGKMSIWTVPCSTQGKIWVPCYKEYWFLRLAWQK